MKNHHFLVVSLIVFLLLSVEESIYRNNFLVINHIITVVTLKYMWRRVIKNYKFLDVCKL